MPHPAGNEAHQLLPPAVGDAVARTGYPAAFALTGMLMLAALVPAIRDRTADNHSRLVTIPLTPR